MFYEPNSENVNISGNNNDRIEIKPISNENKKKRLCIVISIISGIIVLGIIIFLVIYFRDKRTFDGGSMIVLHVVEEPLEDLIVFNDDNIDHDNYKVLVNQTFLTGVKTEGRRLETLEKNIYNCKNKGIGTVQFEIKFSKELNSMSKIFSNSKTLKTVDLSNLRTENIKSLESTFYDCKKLQHVTFNNFNSKNLENMDKTFEGCTSITEIDLSSFETPRLKSMQSTFKNCEKLTVLDMNKFITTADVNKNDLFTNAPKLRVIKVEDKNTRKIMIEECDNEDIADDVEGLECEKGSEEKCKDCDGIKCGSCNDGYYKPNNGNYPISCNSCFDKCTKCEDYMKCTECEIGYHLTSDDLCFENPTDEPEPTDNNDISGYGRANKINDVYGN